MATPHSTEAEIIEEIKNLELRRCAALVAGDTDTLGWVMSDDAVVYHGSGSIELKKDFVPNVPRRLEISKAWQRDVTYRVRGNVVIANGFYEMVVRQKLRPGTDFYLAVALFTAVWEYIAGRWQLVVLHQTRVPPDLSPK